MELTTCAACARHVRVDEARCPFCGATLDALAPRDGRWLRSGSAPSRSAGLRQLGLAGVLALGAGCGGPPASQPRAAVLYGGPSMMAPDREETVHVGTIGFARAAAELDEEGRAQLRDIYRQMQQNDSVRSVTVVAFYDPDAPETRDLARSRSSAVVSELVVMGAPSEIVTEVLRESAEPDYRGAVEIEAVTRVP